MENVGGLLGGGVAKGMLATHSPPLANYWGGGTGTPPAPMSVDGNISLFSTMTLVKATPLRNVGYHMAGLPRGIATLAPG